jgi:hypothetical protein
MVVWLVLGRGRAACVGCGAGSGGGEGVDGGGVEAAEDRVEEDLADWDARRWRRGIGSLGGFVELSLAELRIG